MLDDFQVFTVHISKNLVFVDEKFYKQKLRVQDTTNVVEKLPLSHVHLMQTKLKTYNAHLPLNVQFSKLHQSQPQEEKNAVAKQTQREANTQYRFQGGYSRVLWQCNSRQLRPINLKGFTCLRGKQVILAESERPLDVAVFLACISRRTELIYFLS